ncbi:MAG: FtsX-like permease family protein [Dehalococcoidia bacterium]
MTTLVAAWRLALERIRANWKLLTAVLLGVLAAVVLLASAPLYSGVLNDLGLRYTLRREPPARSDLIVQLNGRPSRQNEFAAANGAIENEVEAALGRFVGDPVRYGKSASLFVYRPDQPIAAPGQTPNNQPRGYVQFADGIGPKLRITAGAWPNLSSGDIPAVAGSQAVAELGLKVGDTVLLSPVNGGDPVRIQIAALGEPVDPDDRFWTVGAVRLSEQARDWVILPLVVAPDRYFAAAERASSDFTWLWPTDTGQITTANAAELRQAIGRLRSSLPGAVQGVAVVTALDSILGDYLAKLAVTEVPLYLLILQIVGLVLFYLVLVANVLVDRQAGEIALLKSRGASGGQILLLYLIEGAAMCVVAVVVGPPLAALLTSSLGRLPGSPLAGGGALPVRLGPETWLLAMAGAVLALIALLIPASRAARTSIVLYRRQAARGGGPPLWQRYYLDVVLLVFALFGFWSIRQQSALGGAERVDPLLLLAPALLALAVSAAFLRLFPLAMRLFLRLAGGAAPAPILIGLTQMSRRPAPYTRLILLLTLTTSLGLFAATFSGTIDRSYRDRTAYRVGADARIAGINGGAGRPKAQVLEAVSVPGLGAATAAYRTDGQVGPTQQNQRYQFLALDAQTAPNVVWFRPDFADRSLGDLIAQVADEGAIVEGPVLPDGGETLGLWVRPTPRQDRLNLIIRLRDAEGKLLDLELGRLDFADWRYLEAPLESLGAVRGPLRLAAIYLQPAGGFSEPGGGAVLLDDLAIREKGGIRRIVDPLDSTAGWEALRDGVGEQQDSLSVVRADTRTGTPAVRFAWSPRRSFGTRGLKLRDDETPLPVLASPNFLRAASRQVGETLLLNIGDRTVSAEIRGTLDLFATLDPDRAGFVVAALEPTLVRVNAVPGRPVYPNEVFLDVSGDGAVLEDVGVRGLAAREVLSVDGLLSEASNDPLVAAGWSGILTLAFLAALLLSLVGFLVQSVLVLQRRIVEFAILRTMGLSYLQLGGLIAFEQVFLILCGIAAGTLLGLQIGALMLPFLELTERGTRILPPFVITTQWQAVVPAYGLLALFFAGAIGAIGVVISHLPIGRSLRIGE